MSAAWRGALRVLRAVWRHPLNAGGRMAALLRVARWQLRARCGIGRSSVPFVGHTRLTVMRGLHAASGNWYCGLLEAGEMAFALHVLRAADLFVDVGANVGSYTLLAAGVVGARVIAVEPLPEAQAHLRRNLALNALVKRVQVVAAGIGAHSGRARFTTALGSANRRLTDTDAAAVAAVETDVTTLDALLGDATPVLIKIDIEGQELAALQGAERVLSRMALRALIVETDAARAAGPDDNRLLGALLARHGFAPFRYEPRSRLLEPAGTDGANTVFIRDLDWVQARVRSAPRFRLVNGWI